MDETIQSEVERVLSDLLSAHDRRIRREVDASNCRTRSDWDRLHEAQDAYHETYAAAVESLVALAARPAPPQPTRKGR